MFEKLDKIVIDKKDVDKIGKFVLDTNAQREEFNTPLEKGVLIYSEQIDTIFKGVKFNGLYTQAIEFYFGEFEKGYLKIKSYIKGENDDNFKLMVVFTLDVKDGKVVFDVIEDNSNTPRKQLEEDVLSKNVVLLMDTLYYMCNYKKNEIIEITETKTVKKKKNGKNKRKVKDSVVKITTKKYVFDKKKIPSNSVRVKRIFQWEVRGHWRTYKDGKKVWIKPYQKGDREGERIQKNYKF